MDTFAKPVPCFDLYYDASSRTTYVYCNGYDYAGCVRYGSTTHASDSSLHLLPEQDGAGQQPRHDTSGSVGDVRAGVD